MPYVWKHHAADEAATSAFAGALAATLAPGDCLTLAGELGAGKSVFARAVIRTMAAPAEIGEIPSPTFTLVQSYDAGRAQVSHFDLYRLGAADELAELGFEDALAADVTLIEWPDRAGALLPADRLDITIAQGESETARDMTLTGHGLWADRLQRLEAVGGFLDKAGWETARRRFLHGDASNRRYQRLDDGTREAVLMDAPPPPDAAPSKSSYAHSAKLAVTVKPFVAIARLLREQGFSAPEIHAADLESGFVLLEDFGSETILRQDGTPDPERYVAAAEMLTAFRTLDWPDTVTLPDGDTHKIPRYDETVIQAEAGLLPDWFAPALAEPLTDSAREEFSALWHTLTEALDAGPDVLILRDYHSPNIMWLPEREGINRVGLLDFQDALIGHPAFDLGFLAQDARVDVPAALEDELVARYVEKARALGPFDEEAFRRAYAVLTAEHNTRLLGTFTRLWKRDAKPAYLRHMPRVSRYLARALAHDDLAPLKQWYERYLPLALDADSLARIR